MLNFCCVAIIFTISTRLQSDTIRASCAVISSPNAYLQGVMSETAGPGRSAAPGGTQVWNATMPAWTKDHFAASRPVLILPAMQIHNLLCPAVLAVPRVCLLPCNVIQYALCYSMLHHAGTLLWVAPYNAVLEHTAL